MVDFTRQPLQPLQLEGMRSIQARLSAALGAVEELGTLLAAYQLTVESQAREVATLRVSRTMWRRRALRAGWHELDDDVEPVIKRQNHPRRF
jgi:L-alanine-DL-glutamate epimerase-like enolase superfamily enzyme